MKLFSGQAGPLCPTVALLLLFVAAAPEASAGPASGGTGTYKQSAKATLDFIAHEQASGQAEVAAQNAPPLLPSTPSPVSRHQQRGDTKQSLPGLPGHPVPLDPYQQRRQNASAAPKRDWELVPPRQAAPAPTPRPPQRPTPPTYAGVVKSRQDAVHDAARIPSITTARPRVHNIPIEVEGYRAADNTTTERSSWYSKFFSGGSDDSHWGRQRRSPRGGRGRGRSHSHSPSHSHSRSHSSSHSHPYSSSHVFPSHNNNYHSSSSSGRAHQTNQEGDGVAGKTWNEEDPMEPKV